HPADVGRRDEVPGWAQDVRAEDTSFIERRSQLDIADAGEPKSKPPARVRVLLRLDGTHPRNKCSRVAQPRSNEPLVAEAPCENVHGSSSSYFQLRTSTCSTARTGRAGRASRQADRAS